jgi:hypothetical protein
MKRILTIVFGLVLVLGMALPAAATEILYTLTDLGSGNWEYDYTVSNTQLAVPLGDFVVYFPDVASSSYLDYTLISSTEPTGWTGFLSQPSAIDLGGYYEAYNWSTPIGVGATLSGFSVQFHYAGTAELGSQYFEVYDENLALVDSDYTKAGGGPPVVPEPSTIILLGSGIAGLGMARKKLRKI